jgi:UPF0271 protein
MAEKDEKIAEAVCRSISMLDKDIKWLTYSGTKTRPIAESMGLQVVEECYADRAYNADFTLVARKEPGAVIKDLSEIKRRITQLVTDGTMTTFDGKVLNMSFQSIAVHGDTPGALDLVREIRAVLEENQVRIKPMSQLIG